MSYKVENTIQYKDCLYTNTRVMLSFWDRIKVLFGKALIVGTIVDTENVIGQHQTHSSVSVQPFFRRKDKFPGMEVSHSNDLNS
jgi:hypothetical protein